MSVEQVQFVRVFRTRESERFLIQNRAGADLGAVDLHYLADRKVAGTVFLLDERYSDEGHAAGLLQLIDDQLLPDVSISEGSVAFTVVIGRVVGNFVPATDE